MLRKLCLLATLSVFLPGDAVIAGTFGKVVSIGGHASDVALDEPRTERLARDQTGAPDVRRGDAVHYLYYNGPAARCRGNRRLGGSERLPKDQAFL